jgi:LEA14-like dessication related protein
MSGAGRSNSRVRSAARGRALLVAAALAWLGCASLGRSSLISPEVSVIGVEPVSSTLFESEVRVRLRVSNANEVPLELDGLRFQLDLNGAPFARGRSSEPVSVPRLGDAEVAVLVRTTAADVLRQLSGMTQGGELDYRISGDLFLKRPEQRRLPFRDASE